MSRHPHVDYAMKIPGVYSEAELESLRQEVEKLPEQSKIVEIGILYGRTASLYLQALLERPLSIHLVDNWCVNQSDAQPAFMKMFEEFTLKARGVYGLPQSMDWGMSVYNMDSAYAVKHMMFEVDLLHIDGNHHDPGPQIDCQLYLPMLKSGSVVVFHDYNTKDIDGETLVFPGLHETIDYYTAGWENLGNVDSQTKRRKP